MTAPKPKETLTREWIEWFAAYYKRRQNWGIFHAALAAGHYDLGAADNVRWFADNDKAVSYAELRKAVGWFNRLSPSQRRRLGHRAEDLADTIVRS